MRRKVDVDVDLESEFQELYYLMSISGPRERRAKIFVLLLHQEQGVWGTASPLLIESFFTSL